MKDRKLSKFLSLILRHRPEVLGITLDEYGWASTQEIIDKMQEKGRPASLEMIQEVVRDNDKQRFKLSEDNSRIRANQGHSIKIDLNLTPLPPPPVLYHGTAVKNRTAILKEGIQKRNRQHVHLSADRATAQKVGQRHGKPIIFVVNTYKMYQEGILFYQSDNGVWLTDYVAPIFLMEKRKG